MLDPDIIDGITLNASTPQRNTRWIEEPPDRMVPRAVVVGGGRRAARLLSVLSAADRRAVRLLGYVDDRPHDAGQDMPDLPWLGTEDALFRLIRDGRVDQVIVALPPAEEDHALAIVRELADYPVDVRLAPDPVALHFVGRRSSRVGGLDLLNLIDRPISGRAYRDKRIKDVLLAAAFLLLAVPVLALIALAIRLDSPGPVLFRQQRIGFNNQMFQVLKLRTMRDVPPGYRDQQQVTRDDPRVTRVGRFLRRASLDELPQLINVLRGEMSLVGPRPHAPGTSAGGRSFEQIVARYAARHRVRPGMTGLAQVRGLRGETQTEERLTRRVEADLEYIERWSIGLDLMILIRTLPAIVSRRNAY